MVEIYPDFFGNSVNFCHGLESVALLLFTSVFFRFGLSSSLRSANSYERTLTFVFSRVNSAGAISKSLRSFVDERGLLKFRCASLKKFSKGLRYITRQV